MITRAPSTSSPLSSAVWQQWLAEVAATGSILQWSDPTNPDFGKLEPPHIEGLIAYANGTDWDPAGDGAAGLFKWTGGAWSPFGDMISSGASTDSNLAEFDGPSGQKLKDGGLAHADTADAIALRHARLHLLNSTGDHASGIGPTRIMIADANGLPAQGTSTDAQVSGAVGHKATEDAIAGLVYVDGHGGYSGVAGTSQSLTVVTGVNFTAQTVSTVTLTIENGVITAIA